MDTMQVTSPVEFDEKLRLAHEAAWNTQNQLDSVRNAIHLAAGDRQEYIGRGRYWRRTAAEVLQTVQMMAQHNVELPASVSRGGRRTAASLLQEEGTLLTQLAEELLAIQALDEIYARPENRWNRYYRCLNSDGHIHSSLRGCHTVNNQTAMGWNTHLSGQPVAAAIADLGPTLCTACYPDAPAEHRQKKSDVERAAREAEKARKAEAKYVKRLRDDELFRVDRELVETVNRCLEVLRSEVEFRDYYGRGEHPFHREYWEAAHVARAVLIAREERQPGTGRTAEQIDQLIENAVKRNRKAGARI
jgi:hypothetical protein